MTLDLSKCLSKVSEVSSSVASLPHSMQVDIALGEDDMPKEEIRYICYRYCNTMFTSSSIKIDNKKSIIENYLYKIAFIAKFID